MNENHYNKRNNYHCEKCGHRWYQKWAFTCPKCGSAGKERKKILGGKQ